MNALVGYRGGSLGNFAVTHQQRETAALEITSSYRAKLSAVAQGSPSAKVGAPDSVARPANNELGRDAFLQLLVLQLQNQDPLEPVGNTEMIAQLAQFSSLEGIENLNNNFELLAGNLDQLNFISAQGLIGKHVEGVNNRGQVTAGVVDSVYLDGSIVVLNVDGQIMSMTNVLAISGEAPDTRGDAPAGEEETKRGPIQKIGASINNVFDRS